MHTSNVRDLAPRRIVVREMPAHALVALGAVHVKVNPENLDRLSEVASDWLFEECGPVGREKLLREHDLLAA